MIRNSAILLEKKNGDRLVIVGLGSRHCLDIVNNLKDEWLDNNVKKVEGFVRHDGVFLDREEALEHAFEVGQIAAAMHGMKMEMNDKILRSEEIF